MEFRITVKLALTVEEPVKPVQHALMGSRIKVKLALTAEDLVLLVVRKKHYLSRNRHI